MKRLMSAVLAIMLGAALLAPAAHAQQGGITGDLPRRGVALVTWGGGSVEALSEAAAAEGCDVVSAWVTVGGAFIGHVVGAPSFVNAAFEAQVGTSIAPDTPLAVVCSPSTAYADESALFATVVPDWIDGLSTESETHLRDPYDSFATWPVIEGYPLVGDQVSAVIAEKRAVFEERVGTPVPGSPIIPEFNITFDILVASGTVIGVRLEQYEFLGASGANFATTLWFDTAADGRVPATALLAGPGALQDLAEMARAALQRDRPDLSLPDVLQDGTAPTAANYHAIGFTPAGDLLIEFDEYQVGPGASGSPRVVVPHQVAEPLLSEFGARARQEVVASSRTLALPGVPVKPAPTPPPVVTGPGAPPVDCQAVACVALTFDDGPARHTAGLLDLLAARGSRATFFVIGSSVPYRPQLLARMVDEGHEVGNHTMDHRDLTKLGREEVLAQVGDASRVIADATGHQPRLLRPPYGAVDDTVAEVAGMPLILWSVDPRDWADHDAALVAERVAADASRGSIVLMHDIHETTILAMPAILDGFAQRGLKAVTVSELLGEALEDGRVYRSQ